VNAEDIRVVTHVSRSAPVVSVHVEKAGVRLAAPVEGR
jgi:hypothetical protein